MKPGKTGSIQAALLMLPIILLGHFSHQVAYAFPVPELPGDNLIVNPWFRSESNSTQAGFDGWTRVLTDGISWGPSQKVSNPSPDIVVAGTCGFEQVYCGTAARWAEQSGVLYPNIDVFAYQIVAADPSQRNLKFFAHYVSHRVDVGAVKIYGSDSADGPWTLLWVPLYHSQDEQIVPESRDVVELWEETGFLERAIERGYPYYKVELQSRLPEWHMIRGVGFKITGIYFATEFTDEPGVPPPVGSSTVTTAGAAGDSATPMATETAEEVAPTTVAPDFEPRVTDSVEVADAEVADLRVTTLTAEPVSATAIVLTWDVSENNNRGLSLERSRDGVTGWNSIARIGPEASEYTDSGLTPDTIHYYRLKATQQDISVAVSARTLALVESAPATAAAPDIAPSGSELTGEDVPDREEPVDGTGPSQLEQPDLAEDAEQAEAASRAGQMDTVMWVTIVGVLVGAGLLLVRIRLRGS
jgi:hypothetical protein